MDKEGEELTRTTVLSTQYLRTSVEYISSSMSAMVPQEIFDLCIDWLEASHESSLPTLKTCTLICSSWLPRARYHIFRRLSVDFRFRFRETLPELINQLRTEIFANPSIVPYVRVLSLQLQYSLGHQTGSESPYEILSDIPFTHLQQLHINFACSLLTKDYPWRLSRLLRLLKNNPYLEHLSLRNFAIDAQSMHELLRTLATYSPCMKTLALDDIRSFRWSKTENAWPTPPRPISLERLLVFDGPDFDLMSFVFRHGFFDWNALKTLALVGSFNEAGVKALVESECGRNTSFLTLDLRNLRSENLLEAILGNFTQLHKLQLLPPSVDNHGILSYTLEQLGRQPSFEQLASLYISNPILVFPLDTQLVELTKAMPSLRHVSFNFGSWLQENAIDPADMKSRLPLTGRTGVLDSQPDVDTLT
ncbi:hypothetical protein GGU11DRAFT_565269 [Lentinula aff. detonsa]|uniref:Uncharacterized protein n=1 Tax=Lentinula aff. detonsa TaxID=2804958 RepID=A0AA38NLD6_9AGAR|nr:hypothetical protein GGU10DRAFT_37518 [Lentinula aff. detonsa]KAJ3798686.1 hypothetical protein GGU11DRAFT_565269 [Lentinula aff. detonsa]